MASGIIPKPPLYSVFCSLTISIGDGTAGAKSKDLDLSSFIPEGKKIVAFSNATIGSYVLPYIITNGTTKTYIALIINGGKGLRITNTTSAWENFSFSVVLYLE